MTGDAEMTVQVKNFASGVEAIPDPVGFDRSYDPVVVRRVMNAHTALTEEQASNFLAKWLSNDRKHPDEADFRKDLMERIGCTAGTVRHLQAQLEQATINPDAATNHVLSIFSDLVDTPVLCKDVLYGYAETASWGQPLGIFEEVGDLETLEIDYVTLTPC